MIKAIAVDMDGTFLNSQSTFDRPLFEKVYAQLQAKDVEFVVASGNPIYQLVEKRFPKEADGMAFVAENGVELIDRGQEIYCGQFTKEQVETLVAFFRSIPGGHLIISGRHHAFAFADEDPLFVKRVQPHYIHMQQINSLADIDDPVVKFMMDVPPKETRFWMDEVIKRFGSIVHPVSSGYGNMDLIIPGMDKATGLKRLLPARGWQPSQLMAFGDGQNDATMLKLAGESYAMAQSAPEAIAAAQFRCGSNDENGVLNKIIERFDLNV